MPKCSATKANGTPCERLIDASAIYCYSHDGERAQQRSRAASKAARSKGGSTELGEVKAQLRTLADDVISGTIDKGSASVAAQVLGVFIRAVEQERKIREQEELEARIQQLEEMQEQKGGKRWEA
jgi:hypothetical protein